MHRWPHGRTHQRRVPAVMLCHWPGLYGNGSEEGFQQFQSIVLALAARFGDQTRWMKISEIGRYWAAKELTKITVTADGLALQAPFACRDFTVAYPSPLKPVVLLYQYNHTKVSPLESNCRRR